MGLTEIILTTNHLPERRTFGGEPIHPLEVESKAHFLYVFLDLFNPITIITDIDESNCYDFLTSPD